MTKLHSWISNICADEEENKRSKGKLNCFRYRVQFNSEQNFSEDDLKSIKQTLDNTFTKLQEVYEALRSTEQ